MSSTGPRPPALHFRLGVERLEDRTVPAGNITASVSGRVLFLVGDDLANQIRVDGTGSWGAIVRPLGDTTLNGGTAAIQFRGVDRGYDVRVFGGDDQVLLSGIVAHRGLRVELGDGDDILALERVKSRRVTTIFGGTGEDVFTITGSDLRRRVAIDQGGGDDRLATSGTKFGRDTYFTGGDGVNVLGVGQGNHFRRRQPTVSGYVGEAASPPPAPAPRAGEDFGQVTSGGSVTIDVLANDVANAGALDRTSVVITSPPAVGTVVVNDDGTVTYTSTGSITELDTFSYTVANTAGGTSNEGVVTLSVTASTSPPPPPTDTTPPTVTLSTPTTNPVSGTAVPFTARFDENVTGFDQSDVAVLNGTVSNFVATSATTYTFDVTPGVEVPVRVVIAAGAARDAAGNANAVASSVVLPSLSDPNWQAVGTQGLRFWDVQAGDGSAVTATSTITVRYTGWLAADGTVFDTTGATGNPATFPLQNLIQGWQQALPGMRVGGIRRLDIPSALGYGALGSPPSIPPNARLVFQIELVNEA